MTLGWTSEFHWNFMDLGWIAMDLGWISEFHRNFLDLGCISMDLGWVGASKLAGATT